MAGTEGCAERSLSPLRGLSAIQKLAINGSREIWKVIALSVHPAKEHEQKSVQNPENRSLLLSRQIREKFALTVRYARSHCQLICR
jgi:hypothetical protein